MERRIDLDAAAREITSRADRWRADGLSVGDVTWRDAADAWPYELKTNRDETRDPDSIGVRCTKDVKEGSIVLYRGGWTDVEFWSGNIADEPLIEHPGYEDWLTISAFGAVLDRFAVLFR